MPHTPHTPELPLRFRSTFRAASTPLDDPSSIDTSARAAVSSTPSEQDAAAAMPLELDVAAGVQQDAAPRRAESAAVEPEPTAALDAEPTDEPIETIGEPIETIEVPTDEPASQPQLPQEPVKRSGPRHRAERLRNRRPTGAAFRRTVALGCASAIMGVSALGAVAASADVEKTSATVSANAADRATPDDTIAAADVEVQADDGPSVTSDLSVAAAPFTGGTQVTVTGEELDQVAAVTVGGTPATIVAADAGQVTFAVPAVSDTALGTSAEVQFADAAGQPIDVETQTGVVAAGTSVVQPLEGELTAAPEPEAPTAPRTLSLTYTSDPGIDAQLGYVLAYWSSYNTAQYPVIDGYD